MKVIHEVFSLAQNMGGPPMAVAGLCNHLAEQGLDIQMCTTDMSRHYGPNVPLSPAVKIHSVPVTVVKPLKIWLPRGFKSMMGQVAHDADVIHLNGLWLTTTRDAADFARRRGIPYVISLHGLLSPHALSHRAWKKKLVRLWFADRALRHAACLHALTQAEAGHARAFGCRNPVAVIPNGVDLTQFETLPPPDEAMEHWPELAGKRVILFIGRLHPIKGLDHLVEAWARVAKAAPSWHLMIAGPDESLMAERLKARAAAAGIADRLTFGGAVWGRKKLALLGAASWFALSSFTEGFSMSLLEAMASGLPSISTPQCNFGEIACEGAGLLAEPNADAWTAALTQAVSMPPAEHEAMKMKALELVRRKYSWPSVARQMVAVYQWMRGGDKPTSICQ